VLLKLASTLDGRIAGPDGSSRWITGEEARRDVHRLRAESDAILVGAGTVRADDPQLTVRLEGATRQPLRVVLGRIPATAVVHPALELHGDLGEVLDQLGERGVLQLLVEGGARVAHAFHTARLVDRYVFYLAPALLGGSDGLAMFHGPGAPSLAAAMRGALVSVHRLGDDLRVELARETVSPGGPDHHRAARYGAADDTAATDPMTSDGGR
jgi:diaminohydroxyphosphoribosylaminopyrimidine deaminase/5-amino-6-(5-phosphoribosylamino)uracil reductase